MSERLHCENTYSPESVSSPVDRLLVLIFTSDYLRHLLRCTFLSYLRLHICTIILFGLAWDQAFAYEYSLINTPLH